MTELTRREFLLATLAPVIARLQAPAGGQLLGTIPFGAPGARLAPLNRLLGSGLDARLFTDLSTVSLQSDLVTPNDRFYVRTATPDNLPPSLGRARESSPLRADASAGQAGG